MENVDTGLLLMVVGMTTVFAILLIVIFLGKGLIVLVNKYAPEVSLPTKSGSNPEEIPSSVLAAIVSAVNIVTGGKGKVTNVEKL